MEIVEEELMENIKEIVNHVMPARELFREAFRTRKRFHSSREFIKLDYQVPWQEFLFECEEEAGVPG